MSRQIHLVPELQQLFDDLVSVHQRFTDLAEAFVSQRVVVQKQKIELENANVQISAMKIKQTEHEGILKSYNQLKNDYELKNMASENHREEIQAENMKRVRDLEEELKSARAKSSQQAELHQSSVTQIVADYGAKLRAADEKIRQLNKIANNNPKATKMIGYVEDTPSALMKKSATSRGRNKKWPQLDVEIKSKELFSSGRGPGRERGAGSKRKLFKLDDGRPIDLD